jgi:predicted NACHT family NTPase
VGQNRKPSIALSNSIGTGSGGLSDVPQHPEKSIDDLVQEVRSQAYPDSKDGTKHPCKTMRMLRVNYPVPVDGIYVKLNVLNRISGDFSSSDWQRNFQSNLSNFDRWGLGTVNQSQVSALSMVQKSSRLMVLGKPGSGKTTFLKSLLVECVEGRLRLNQQDYVPIFITLKDFAKASQKQIQSNLSNYIYQEFCSWGLRNSLKDRQVVEKILAEERALILLDGLDEVPEEVDEKSQELDQESVINEVINFSKSNNRIVITCRISQKYMWEGFTDVEIADFEKEEREEFVKKWFAVVNGNAESDQLAEQLIWQLQEPKNQQIAQLAVTPILLNLICIKFRDGDGKLPKNRADFYEDGVTILLKEWDATKPAKGVKRKTVHNSLKGIDDKKRLLAKVAAILFEQNDYLPKQEKLKELISNELDVSLQRLRK